jgi:hypothetical protein
MIFLANAGVLMKTLLTTAALIFLLMAGPSMAQSLDYQGSALWSWLYDVQISGNYAYCTTPSGLLILDIATPQNPSLLGKFRCINTGWPIAISGNYAYLSAEEGLKVINVSDFSHPLAAGFLSVSQITEISISDHYAFLSRYDGAFSIVDITDPSNPTLAASSIIAKSVVARGQYVYAVGVDGFSILQLNFPANPLPISSLAMPASCTNITIAGDYAYIIGGAFNSGSFLSIVNISNPAAPYKECISGINGNMLDIAVAGDYAFIADNIFGTRIIDISNPFSPRPMSTVGPDPKAHQRLCLKGNYAYVTDEYLGLLAFDISIPTLTHLAGIYRVSPPLINLAVSGRYAFITRQNSFGETGIGVALLDITTLSNPDYIGILDVESFGTFGVDVVGNYVYIGSQSLNIYDISNPASPSRIGSYGALGVVDAVKIRDSYAYIADGGYSGLDGLEIVDVSDPMNPTFVDTVQTLGDANDIAVQDGYAYITSGNRMYVINIENPTDPHIEGAFETGNTALGIAVSGNYAYIAAVWAFYVVNLSYPNNPLMAGYCGISGTALDISIFGNYAYVAAGGGGFYMIDISNPIDPRVISNYKTSQALAVTANNTGLYGVDNNAFLTFKIPGITSCSYIPGDANGDKSFNGIDIVYSVKCLKGIEIFPADSCDCPPNGVIYPAADANGNCLFNGADITYSVNYLKMLGPGPTACVDCMPRR